MPTGINTTAIGSYSNGILYIINYILVPVLIGIAFIVFLWGVFKYFIWGGDDEAERSIGKKYVMWGVVGFVVILSLWGIVNLVMNAFGLTVGHAPPAPTFNPAQTM